MKILFAISMAINLIALVGALRSQAERSDRTLTTGFESANTTAQAIMTHEAYIIWDKRFDRYASYWLQTFGEMHSAQNPGASHDRKSGNGFTADQPSGRSLALRRIHSNNN